jgi:glycosyltransferase involved in cell wall biosynthesis
VVDDGSTDDTPEVVKEYPVKYVRATGVGRGEVRNYGIKQAQGEFLAFLDDDDQWLPNNITPQLALLEAHPEFGAAHARVWLTDGQGNKMGNPVPEGDLATVVPFESLLTYWPQIGSLVVRKSVYNELGGLDASLFGDAEWDWLLRIAEKYPVGRSNEVVVLFKQRDEPPVDLMWQRFPYAVRIFRRHTRQFSLLKRLKLERILLRHRGWYTSHFQMAAKYYAERGDKKTARKAAFYAFRISPPHAILGYVRGFLKK